MNKLRLDPISVMRTCGFILVSSSTLLILLNLFHPVTYIVAAIAILTTFWYIPKVSDTAYFLAAIHLTAGIYYSAFAVVCLAWAETFLCAAYFAYLRLQEKSRAKKMVRHIIG